MVKYFLATDFKPNADPFFHVDVGFKMSENSPIQSGDTIISEGEMSAASISSKLTSDLAILAGNKLTSNSPKGMPFEIWTHFNNISNSGGTQLVSVVLGCNSADVKRHLDELNLSQLLNPSKVTQTSVENPGIGDIILFGVYPQITFNVEDPSNPGTTIDRPSEKKFFWSYTLAQ